MLNCGLLLKIYQDMSSTGFGVSVGGQESSAWWHFLVIYRHFTHSVYMVIHKIVVKILPNKKK